MAENLMCPYSITEELAEETGWHIGDGSMNFYNNKGKLKGIYQLRGHIYDDREHYIQRIKPIFKSLYNIDLSLREMASTRVFGFQIWSNKLVNFKKGLGLPLGKKFDIIIPLKFLESDELKMSVIRGIFDTDGCIYLEMKNKKLYPRIEICTISEILGEQLLILFNELGLRTTKYSYLNLNDSKRKRVYKVSIRGYEMFDKFMNIIKPANPKHINKYIKYKESFK